MAGEILSGRRARSVLLRIAKDSPEAGFLAPICPITRYPTVIVIIHGMLREYIVPDISKEDFRNRVTAALDDSKPQSQANASSARQEVPEQAQGINSSPAPAPESVTAALSIPQQSPQPTALTPSGEESQTQSAPEQQSQAVSKSTSGEKGKDLTYAAGRRKYSARRPREKEEPEASQPPSSAQETTQQKDTKGKAPIRTNKKEKPASHSQSPASRPTPTAVPPSHYRLQVRLFDGSSVRSTFEPSHTIRKDVRAWLDTQLEEKRPYNIKLILTPQPNKTLTIAEEDQELRELITGSTATFVLVPVQTYIEAYSHSGSLPVRAVSSVYGMITSMIGGVIGYIGSFIGYAQGRASSSQPEAPQSSEPQVSGESTGRSPRQWGANIRTLGDQRDGQDSEFYNGNQLNFEPRRGDE
ncbi:UBX domain protein [Aspergillus mulundensis]|uniref:UBX domain-containing protein n=1 Tax=Aspergillus mulundensis TaxID=1810919 RepID=A0A3D8SIQ0_9EURO|nr:hypothetical protein DSM5745_02808 [Aspergillus mulundensis]RDW86166.1 hypothetical protein DSM5745_02808 [Aspergillus mulundensis]